MKKLIVILIISLSICIGEIFLLIHLFPQTGLARIVYIPFYIILMILLTIILFRKIKDKELKTLEEYKEAYGSDAYGLTAFLLNKIRVYSIPFGFVAIIIAAIYQYIIGLKKLDVRDKGFALMIASVTIVLICQVLPLVFAIVVKGWRG